MNVLNEYKGKADSVLRCYRLFGCWGFFGWVVGNFSGAPVVVGDGEEGVEANVHKEEAVEAGVDGHHEEMEWTV